MDHLFLINPAAGSSDATDRISAQVHALCDTLGEPCEIQISKGPGDLSKMTQEAGASGRETKVYACGGDGTLNEVASGAMGFPNLSVTSIPCGSGNDYVKQFPNTEAFYSMENFSQTRTDQLDLISAGDAIAVNVCSVGFDARIGTDINAFRRFPLLSGSRAYLASIAVNLIRGVVKPCRVELPEGIVIDEKLALACICNGGYYGGGFHPVPQADLEDGLLDVLVVKKVSRLTVAKVISAYQKGRYAEYPDLISYYKVPRVRIITPEPEPVNLDGELMRSRDTEFKVLPGKLRFFSPVAAWDV